MSVCREIDKFAHSTPPHWHIAIPRGILALHADAHERTDESSHLTAIITVRVRRAATCEQPAKLHAVLRFAATGRALVSSVNTLAQLQNHSFRNEYLQLSPIYQIIFNSQTANHSFDEISVCNQHVDNMLETYNLTTLDSTYILASDIRKVIIFALFAHICAAKATEMTMSGQLCSKHKKYVDFFAGCGHKYSVPIKYMVMSMQLSAQRSDLE